MKIRRNSVIEGYNASRNNPLLKATKTERHLNMPPLMLKANTSHNLIEKSEPSKDQIFMTSFLDAIK